MIPSRGRATVLSRMDQTTFISKEQLAQAPKQSSPEGQYAFTGSPAVYRAVKTVYTSSR